MPNNYSSIKSANDTAISSRDQLAKSVLADTERLKEIESQIRDAKAKGQSTTQLENDKTTITNTLNANKTSLNTTNSTLTGLRADYEAYIDHTAVVSNLTDSVPILLFPVRLETRFNKDTTDINNPVYELWLRIFPDDLAIEAHEEALTLTEIELAKEYWTSIWPPASANQTKKVNAWDVVCRKCTSQRAAFIIEILTPDDLTTSTPVFKTNAQLETKYTTWTKAPETRVMPDVFVANLYDTYNPTNPIPAKVMQGKPIPYSLKVGIDPNDDSSLSRNGVNLDANSNIKWLIDFVSAVNVGMGMKIPITQSQYDNGFERITVLGVKALVNDTQGKQIIEDLVDNHHYNTGFSLLKQGTNTKNTQDGPSGYTDYEFGNVLSHNVEREAKKVTFNNPLPNDDFQKNDGQRLAEALGVKPELFDHIYSADSYDIRNAMNMNSVLFNTTIAYTMNVVMYPAFSNVSVYDPTEETREYVTRYARSRGALSSIRIKKQPYGILPVTAFSKLQALPVDPKKNYYEDLYDITSNMDATWTSMAQNVKVAGDSDSQQSFVEALGKHAVSKEYYSRYGLGPNYIWNNLVLNDMPGEANQWYTGMQQFAQDFTTQTGFNFTQVPYILQMNFKQEQGRIITGLIDSQPLSETEPVEPIGGAGTGSTINYIEWIRISNLIQLRDEDFGGIGLAGQSPPNNLFYLFLRQSFLLEYFNAACSLLELSESQKREYEIININNVPTEGINIPSQDLYQSGPSRWAIFDMPYGPPGQTVAMYLNSPPGMMSPAMANMVKMKQSLSEMEGLPTSELALLFSEHLDLCAFRLDSWKLGLMNQRLNYMRLNPDGTVKKQGIYIGAYGWVENLNKVDRTKVQNHGLPTTGEYNTESSEGIEANPTNKGFIHAPSQNHAIAAAVLRAGYEANATDTNGRNHEINLTSERVRKSLNIFEGIKNGQKLSTLLGYEFERALHDCYPAYELDKFINPFRTKYKLEILTSEYEGAAETVSAINVLDGKKILDDYKSSNNSVFTGLSVSFTILETDKGKIKDELDKLLGILDAVGDLAVSEGVFQLVNNNYEAANALTSALSGGTNPPDAQIIKTPRNGITLTNKVIKQFTPATYTFENGVVLSNNWSVISKSYRALAEPSLNQWLISRLPEPNTIEIHTTFENSSGATFKKVYLSDLKIQPIDLVYITQDVLSDNESELAQRVKKFVRDEMNFGFDKEITIAFETVAANNKKRFYDLHAYIIYLKKVIFDSRHLKSSEFGPAGSVEASSLEIYDYTDSFNRLGKLINGLVDTIPADPPNEPPALTENYFVYGMVQLILLIDREITAIAAATTPTSKSVRIASLSGILMLAANFGVERAVPKSSEDISENAISDILDVAKSVRDQLEKKRVAASAIYSTLPAVSNTNRTIGSEYVPEILKCMKGILGDSFRMLPQTLVHENTKVVLNAKFNNSNTLLNDHTNHALIMGEWLSGVSRVRKKIANLEMLAVLNDVIEENNEFNTISFKPFQFPYDNDTKDRWQAIKVSDKANIKPGRLCLAIGNDDYVDYSNYITGIVIDDWTEVIPNSDEVTGLAFNYDQPDSKPPQSLLLALPPEFDGTWNWQDLLAVVNETFDEAKKRAVDCEAISNTPFGHILPSIYMPVTEGGMTIGIDFEKMEETY